MCFEKITLDRMSVENRLEELIGNEGRPMSWVMMLLAFCIEGCSKKKKKILEITALEASKETGLFWGSEPMRKDSVLKGEGL